MLQQRRRQGGGDAASPHARARSTAPLLSARQLRLETLIVGVLFVGYVGRFFCTAHLNVSMPRFQESEHVDSEQLSDILATGAFGELFGEWPRSVRVQF